MRNDIQLSMQSKYSSNGQGRLEDQLQRLFSLSDRMICCLLSVLNSLKLLCFLLHFTKENCADLHLSFGRGGSTGTVLPTESGNSNETATNRGEQAPESTSTAARSSTELSFWVPSGRGPEGPGAMPAGTRLREPECLLREQEQNKKQKRGEQTCGRPRLLVTGLQL